MTDPSGSWSGQTYSGTAGKIGSVAEGNGKLIALGDACTIDSASGWTHSAGAPVGVSGCSGIDWSASAYNEALGLYTIGGRVLGTSTTKLGISSTGDSSSWQLIDIPESGTPGPAVHTIAAKTN
ncbi:hypothetical protein CH379_012480 [Leptospira ellisii]|uniref:Uncharacterized protein n=1 Tax=Leptospira ellisii TaxID=2023197 RepID=A0A2N0B5A9_9LEPT|nr:hypothetical protein [Leptospira ellisii]MDV6236444.1 hypothetical protein [Leptospira ellisii]PJZ91735.1 hypothetical protein CH379_17010 [Leptospira ellisii]PKA04758.1 hypothetical protein CH375_09070 [Leptospira ellisii]